MISHSRPTTRGAELSVLRGLVLIFDATSPAEHAMHRCPLLQGEPEQRPAPPGDASASRPPVIVAGDQRRRGRSEGFAERLYRRRGAH